MSVAGPARTGGRPRALILALNGLDHDRRALNEAQSLTAAGFAVTRVGIVAHPDQPLVETTAAGEIVRMRPVWYLPEALTRLTTTTGGGSGPGTPLLRQWSWKVRVMGVIRRSFPKTLKSADRMRDLFRWTREIVTACGTMSPDAIIACDLDTLLAGRRLKRRTRSASLVYDAHELWVDQECHLFLTRPFRAFALMLEGRNARQADLCTTVGAGLADTLAARHRIAAPLVVFNGPDQVSSPEPRPAGPLRLYFQGSYSAGRGIEEAIIAMDALKGRATLTLQGFGELEGLLRHRAAELGLDDGTVTFVPPCPPDQVVRAAAAYDVGLVSVEPICLNNVLSMPNKVFTYLGGGAAILTTIQTPEIAALARRHACGVVADAWSSEGIVRALEPLLGDRASVERLRMGAFEACRTFAWDQQFEPVVRFLIGFKGREADD